MRIFIFRSLIAVSIALSFLLSAGLVSAQKNLIVEIEIRGYRSVSTEEILKNVKSKTTEAFDSEQAKRDLSKIMEMGIFDPLASKLWIQDGPRGDVIIVFDLKESPKKTP